MTTCSCGTEQKEIDRESTVRQYADRFGFSNLSLNTETKPGNPFNPNKLYELANNPNVRASFDGPSLEIERSEDTFCPNFADHQEAYDRLVAEVELVEAATRSVPAAEVENAVDIEMVRTKVETIRTEAGQLSTAQLEEVREELTAMQEALAQRIDQPEGPPDRRRGPSDPPALDRLKSLHEETQQVVATHIEQELATRQDQDQNQSAVETEAQSESEGPSWPGSGSTSTTTTTPEDGPAAGPPETEADAGQSDTEATDEGQDEERVPSCDSCGQQEVRVERQSTARQLKSELEFRKLSLGVSADMSLFGDGRSFDVSLFGDNGSIDPSMDVDLDVDPSMDVNLEPSVELARNEDTFCGNFAGDEEAYHELLEDIDTVDRLATQEGPGQHIEESIDIEMVRTKVEHLPSEVPNLSAAELEQLKDELTAMQTSLSGRLEDLENSQAASHRESIGHSGRAQRLRNLQEQTQQILDYHITEALNERQQQPAQDRPAEPGGGSPETPEQQPDEQPAATPAEPPPCDTCGRDEVRVERQTTVRQLRSELEFRTLSFGGSVTPGLFDKEGEFDPGLDAAPSVETTATFKRSEDTFCGNFAGDEDAYEALVHDINATDRLADRYGPGEHLEDTIDIEMLRSKVQHLRTQVQDLSVEKLSTLKEELTAMQESVTARVKDLQNNQRWAKLRDELGLSSRIQRLQNLKTQAQNLVDNHITTELSTRQQQTQSAAGDQQPGGAPDVTGETAQPPSECERCEEEMAQVRRQGRIRQYTKDMELRELEVGVSVNLVTQTPTPKVNPTFERRPDRFCKNFDGDKNALKELKADVQLVANLADNNANGQYVEDAVNVEMVQSKLETLPESVEGLAESDLNELRDLVTEMRDQLTERIQDLENSQRRLLERARETLDLSSRLERLRNLKEQAVDVINQHLDPELDRRQQPGASPDDSPSSGAGTDGPAPSADSGADAGSDTGTGSRSDGDSGAGRGSNGASDGDTGGDGTAGSDGMSGTSGSSGSSDTNGASGSGTGDDGTGGDGEGASGDSGATSEETEPDADESGDGWGTDGQDSGPDEGDPEPGQEAGDEPDDEQSEDEEPNRRGGPEEDEPEEEEEEKETEREEEGPNQDDGPNQDEAPEEDGEPNHGPML